MNKSRQARYLFELPEIAHQSSDISQNHLPFATSHPHAQPTWSDNEQCAPWPSRCHDRKDQHGLPTFLTRSEHFSHSSGLRLQGWGTSRVTQATIIIEHTTITPHKTSAHLASLSQCLTPDSTSDTCHSQITNSTSITTLHSSKSLWPDHSHAMPQNSRIEPRFLFSDELMTRT